MLSTIELGLAEKLKDRGYRHRFFRGRAKDEIASIIRELRELRKLRQIDLAERCNMKQSAISRIEQSSYSRWNIDTLWRIAEALDVRMRIIFEPMEDVIRQYEEMEKEVQVPAQAIELHRMSVKQQPSPLPVIWEQKQGALSKAKPELLVREQITGALKSAEV